LVMHYAKQHQGRYPTADRELVIPNFSALTDDKGVVLETFLAQSLNRPASGWPLRPTMQLARIKALLEHPGSQRPVRVDTLDDWGHPLLVGIAANGEDFVIASTGKNGVLEPKVTTHAWPISESYNDIVLADGLFLSSPAGATR